MKNVKFKLNELIKKGGVNFKNLVKKCYIKLRSVLINVLTHLHSKAGFIVYYFGFIIVFGVNIIGFGYITFYIKNMNFLHTIVFMIFYMIIDTCIFTHLYILLVNILSNYIYSVKTMICTKKFKKYITRVNQLINFILFTLLITILDIICCEMHNMNLFNTKQIESISNPLYTGPELIKVVLVLSAVALPIYQYIWNNRLDMQDIS